MQDQLLASNELEFLQLLDLGASGFANTYELDQNCTQILKILMGIVAKNYHALISANKMREIDVDAGDFNDIKKAFKAASAQQKIELLQSGQLRENQNGGLELA